MFEHYSNVGNVCNIKKQIWSKLDENPLFRPQEIAKLLDLPYRQYRNYITKERSNWKYYHQNKQGSKCSNVHVHCYKAQVRLDNGLSDSLRDKLNYGVGVGGCIGFGWVLSKSKNRFLVWKGRFGRVVWYETGSVRLFVRKPGNLGRAKQLFSDAFVHNGLLNDDSVLIPILDRIVPKSCHVVYDTGKRLPNFVIDDFVKSHKMLIKVGDRSDPTGVEVISEFAREHEEFDRKQKEFDEKVKAFDEKVDHLLGIFHRMIDKDNSALRSSLEPEVKPLMLDRRADYSW